jgi:hypothetical protein
MLRVGAQRLIHQAVEAELQELLAQHTERRTADGKAGVVRMAICPLNLHGQTHQHTCSFLLLKKARPKSGFITLAE